MKNSALVMVAMEGLDARQKELYKKFPRESRMSRPAYIERIIDWTTFFRRNICAFIENYLGISLHLYQVILIHLMSMCSTIWLIAGRATAKSFLIALYSVARCILYPGERVVVASSTISQARLIVTEKIGRELSYMSPRIRESIKAIRDSSKDITVLFHNGSTITVVVGNENARGYRATILILEECRMIKKKVVDETLKHFLIVRQPPYLKMKEYECLMEESTTIAITSSWYADNWIWPEFDMALNDSLHGGRSMAIGVDYAVTLKHNIKSRDAMEKMRRTMPRETWDLECMNLRIKENTDSFFRLSSFKSAQVIRKAFYPMSASDIIERKKNPYAIEKQPGEVRIVVADLAFSAGDINDNSIYCCMRLIPHTRSTQSALVSDTATKFKRQVVYIESVNGGETLAQAIRLKQLYYDFGADYLVMDVRYAGISVYDLLAKTLYDEERDMEYEPWKCFNNEKLAERAPESATECIYGIIASARLNSDIAQEMARTLADGELELLIDYDVARREVLPKDKNYAACVDDPFVYEAPYMETQALIKECVDLKYERLENTGLIKISERGAARKDRYTAVSYGNYFATSLESDIGKVNEEYAYASFYN